MKLKNGLSNEYKKNIAQDYNYICIEGCLWCQHCRSTYCLRLTQIECGATEIKFHMGCDLCGEDTLLTLSAGEMAYLFMRLKYKNPDDKFSWIYTYLRMYRLLELYPHFLKTKKDQQGYEEFKKRIGKELASPKKVKAIRKHLKYHFEDNRQC